MAKSSKKPRRPVGRQSTQVTKLRELLRQRDALIVALRKQIAGLEQRLAGFERTRLPQPTILSEDLNVRQIKGEPKRRWFSDADLDLVVWLETAKATTPQKTSGLSQATLRKSPMVQRFRSMRGITGQEAQPQQERIIGFQLCYAKRGAERALTWLEASGYSHHAVDAGEEGAKSKRTPLLVTDGEFEPRRLAELFRQHSSEIDQQIAKFVHDRIIEFRSSRTG